MLGGSPQVYITCCLQGDYSAIYDTHCTKSASRQDAEDSSTINLEFTRDDYVRACHHYLGSTHANANRDLSMMTYQTATVSRDDEVRPRRLCQMDTRVMDAIGEQILPLPVFPPVLDYVMSCCSRYAGVLLGWLRVRGCVTVLLLDARSSMLAWALLAAGLY